MECGGVGVYMRYGCVHEVWVCMRGTYGCVCEIRVCMRSMGVNVRCGCVCGVGVNVRCGCVCEVWVCAHTLPSEDPKTRVSVSDWIARQVNGEAI